MAESGWEAEDPRPLKSLSGRIVFKARTHCLYPEKTTRARFIGCTTVSRRAAAMDAGVSPEPAGTPRS